MKRFSVFLILLALFLGIVPSYVNGQHVSIEEMLSVTDTDADETESILDTSSEETGSAPETGTEETGSAQGNDTETPGELPDDFLSGASGAVYGDYTVTNTVSNDADTFITAPGVYEVTGTSNKAIFVESVSCTIILSGAAREYSLSRLQLNGSSEVTLYLAEGTVNTFKCTGTENKAGVVQSGIYVNPNATLTIEGAGTLNAVGGEHSAGIGTSNYYGNVNVSSSGTIIISSGTVNATGGKHSSGIGGACSRTGGTIKIYGGVITATGGDGAAGIGSGYTDNKHTSSGGDITISGGIVTASGGSDGAGIGGGSGSMGGNITISGGIVKADGALHSAGAGIGGGVKGGIGNITISGGTISAAAHGGGNGIGAGHNGGGGTINITGGIITAVTEDNNISGIGGGNGNSGASIKITGGSVFSGNKSNKILMQHNAPTNGAANLYMYGIKLTDERNAIPVSADMYVSVKGNPGYIYHARTNDKGISYLWLPGGTHTALLQNSDNGTSMYYDMTVSTGAASYDPVASITTTNVFDRYPQLSLTSNLLGEKNYGAVELTLDIAGDGDTYTDVEARGVKWFRESAGAPADTNKPFSSGYGGADINDKGEGGAGGALNLVSQTGLAQRQYCMDADKNGRYWMQVYYYHNNLGIETYREEYIEIYNIYTPVELYVRDLHADGGAVIQQYTKLGGQHGAPFDLGGSTILENPRFGYDTAEYPRNKNKPAYGWTISIPGRPFSYDRLNDAFVITLNRDVDENEDNAPNSAAAEKYYTVMYTEREAVENPTLTVSKTVAGMYGNKTKEFAFWVYFTDSTGGGFSSDAFSYEKTGEGLGAPETGALELEPEGSGVKAGFTLKHGQSIEIQGIAPYHKIRIEEEDYRPFYETSFEDLKHPGEFFDYRDTGNGGGNMLDMFEDRAFRFINERVEIVQTGIGSSGIISALFLPVLALLLAALYRINNPPRYIGRLFIPRVKRR